MAVDIPNLTRYLLIELLGAFLQIGVRSAILYRPKLQRLRRAYLADRSNAAAAKALDEAYARHKSRIIYKNVYTHYAYAYLLKKALQKLNGLVTSRLMKLTGTRSPQYVQPAVIGFLDYRYFYMTCNMLLHDMLNHPMGELWHWLLPPFERAPGLKDVVQAYRAFMAKQMREIREMDARIAQAAARKAE